MTGSPAHSVTGGGRGPANTRAPLRGHQGATMQLSPLEGQDTHTTMTKNPDQEQMLARLEASLKWHQAQAGDRAARRAQAAAEAEARALEPRGITSRTSWPAWPSRSAHDGAAPDPSAHSSAAATFRPLPSAEGPPHAGPAAGSAGRPVAGGRGTRSSRLSRLAWHKCQHIDRTTEQDTPMQKRTVVFGALGAAAFVPAWLLGGNE